MLKFAFRSWDLAVAVAVAVAVSAEALAISFPVKASGVNLKTDKRYGQCHRPSEKWDVMNRSGETD